MTRRIAKLLIPLMVVFGLAASMASFADLGAAVSVQEAVISVASKVTPAVVFVSNESITQVDSSSVNPFFDDPFFKDFFGPDFWPFGQPQRPGQGQRQPQKRVQRSSGSGMIIDPAGYILTNNHVVEDATRLTVRLMPEAGLGEAAEFPATVVGTDPRTDTAVIKIDAGRPLPTVEFGDSDAIRVGEWVVAVGSPFGLQASVTLGIVSAVGRNEHDIGINDPSKALFGLIQTDASINPGNSGGPLVDIEGKVIGINTAIMSPSGGNVGIGFAIPINSARRIAEQLIATGTVTRGWLGVNTVTLDPAIAKEFGLEGAAQITDLKPGSPAEKAQLKPFDLITAVDGKPVKNSMDLTILIGESAPGSVVTLSVLREGEPIEVKVTLGQYGEETAQAEPAEQTTAAASLLGITVQAVPEEVATAVGLQPGVGVIITALDPEKPGGRSELMPGDVVVQVGKKVIEGVAGFESAIEANKDRALIPFYVKRQSGDGIASLLIGVRPGG